MDYQLFWQLIEKSRGESSGSNDDMQESLVDLLSHHSEKEILKFGQILGFYIEISDTIPLWMAGKTIMGYCSDDTFLYFRLWVLSQGKEIFLGALADPDSLADSEAKNAADYDLEFEMLMSIPFEAYQAKTGSYPDFTLIQEDLLAPSELEEMQKEISFADDSDVIESQEAALNLIPQKLPRLCALFDFSPDDSLEEMAEMNELSQQIQNGELTSEEALAQITENLATHLQASGLDEETIKNITQSLNFTNPYTQSDQYDMIYPHQIGLAMVRKDNKYGFIDSKGIEVIPCIYDYAQTFCFGKEDFTPVSKDGKHGIIDRAGKELVPIIYDKLDSRYKVIGGIPTDIWRGLKDRKWKNVFSIQLK